MRLHKQSKHGESSIIAFKQNLKSHKQLKHKGYHSKKNGQKNKTKVILNVSTNFVLQSNTKRSTYVQCTNNRKIPMHKYSCPV